MMVSSSVFLVHAGARLGRPCLREICSSSRVHSTRSSLGHARQRELQCRRRGAACATATAPELDITKMAPLADRILVKAAEEDNVSSGGVLLTSSQASNEDAQFGEVLDVGDQVQLKVSQGDTVVYSKYGTTDIEAAGGKVVFVRSDSILGVCA